MENLKVVDFWSPENYFPLLPSQKMCYYVNFIQIEPCRANVISRLKPEIVPPGLSGFVSSPHNIDPDYSNLARTVHIIRRLPDTYKGVFIPTP